MPVLDKVTVLQWGRRNYPAETYGSGDRGRERLGLQWGRRNYPAETLRFGGGRYTRMRCFNGAAGITRRKRARGRPRRAGSTTGFNGAAGITRRKQGKHNASRRQGQPASMGPPELPGGNPAATLRSGRRCSPLQWGRRNYPAETDGVDAVQPLHSLASMGPPELPGGNAALVATTRMVPRRFNGAAGITRRKPVAPSTSTVSVAVLQWGRRNYPAETSLTELLCQLAFLASMGPPELPGGNRNSHGRTVRTYTGFNGAAGITRRKPLLAAVEGGGGKRRFNGAAGITRRKRVMQGRADPGQLASMGPPELPGGNARKLIGNCLRRWALQWGRRNYPAETADCTVRVYFDRSELQWGRRNYPAETLLQPAGSLPEPAASMGPPELPGGNAVGIGFSAHTAVSLQWGRRNYPAETSRPLWSPYRLSLALQWGRRNYPAETYGRVSTRQGRQRRFNGAAGITRRKRRTNKKKCIIR